jgi:hypothetical protein
MLLASGLFRCYLLSIIYSVLLGRDHALPGFLVKVSAPLNCLQPL